MTTAFLEWAAAGFGAELVPVCGPDHGCTHPGKIPHLAGWQKVESAPAMIERWAREHRGNLGLRTARFPAVDLDVEDEAIADACDLVILMTLGSTARRTRANTARRLLLCRLKGPPFRKAAIEFMTAAGAKARIEILGDGQQAVVAGVHHSGATIEWPGGQPVAAELAPMTVALRDEVLEALRRRLVEIGCAVEGRPALPSPRRVHALPPAPELDERMAIAALRSLDPDVGYEEWLRVGMALHAKWPGRNGLELWDAWSSRGEKYPGERVLERHWRSFDASGGVGFGTLIAMGRRAGDVRSA